MTESGTGQPERNELTRRRLLKGGLAAGVARATLSTGAAALIEKAAAATAGPDATLGDIEHVVFLMKENRSFDHYFGTLSGVRGFSDPTVAHQVVAGHRYPVFDQFGYRPGPASAGSPDPSGSASESPAWSSPRSAGAGTCALTPSTTRRSCGSSRRASGWRCPT